MQDTESLPAPGPLTLWKGGKEKKKKKELPLGTINQVLNYIFLSCHIITVKDNYAKFMISNIIAYFSDSNACVYSVVADGSFSVVLWLSRP